MNFLRRLLTVLFSIVATLAVLALLLFAPPVQTLIAQGWLDRQLPGTVTVGTLSAGFTSIDLRDVRINLGDGVLVVPAARVDLPVFDALLHDRVELRSILAPRCLLDLTGSVANGTGGGAPADPVAMVPATLMAAANRFFAARTLPFDFSLGELKADGEVLVVATPDADPVRVRVTATGGGIGPGRTGEIVLTSRADLVRLRLPLDRASATSRATFSFEAPRELRCTAVATHLEFESRQTRTERTLAADLNLARREEGVLAELTAVRGGRGLLTLRGTLPSALARLEGTWETDLRDTDLAAFLPAGTTALALTGSGRFDADHNFREVHLTGDLRVTHPDATALLPLLPGAGPLTVRATFDGFLAQRLLQFDRFEAEVAAPQPIATVRSLQPFAVQLADGAWRVAQPDADWLAVDLSALPLGWFVRPGPDWDWRAGHLAGRLAVRTAGNRVTLRATEPLRSAGLELARLGRPLVRDGELRFTAEIDAGRADWNARLADLTLSAAGQPLAAGSVRLVRRADRASPLEAAGEWRADLDAWAAQPLAALLPAAPTGSTHGTFSLGAAPGGAAFEVKFSVADREPARSITGSVSGGSDVRGPGNFHAALRVSLGPRSSELTLAGNVVPEPGRPVFAELTADDLSTDLLRYLAGPAALTRQLLQPAAAPAAAAPSWGAGPVRLKFACEKLHAAGQPLRRAAGTLHLDAGSLELKGGRAELGENSAATLEGAVRFDPAQPLPYSLAAAGAVERLEALGTFRAPRVGDDAVLSGRLGLTAMLGGHGRTPADLIEHLTTDVKLTAANGAFRLLKVHLVGTNPEKPRPVTDAVKDSVATVGAFFGAQGDAFRAGVRPAPKHTTAVLNFSYAMAEFFYDHAEVRVLREADGAIRLADLKLDSKSARLRGAGRIAAGDAPLFERPLTLDVELSIPDAIAAPLAGNKLVSARKDDAGFLLLAQPLRFGGTLAKIDSSAWYDLLFQAATTPPEPKK